MTRSRVVLISSLVGALLALSGCGGDDDSPVAVKTVTVTVTPTPSPPSTPDTPASDTPETPTPDVASGLDLTQPPTSYDEALAHIAAATDVGSLGRFQTPTGNIYCVLLEDNTPAACEIGDGAIRDPSVCDVPDISPFVNRIEITDGRAVPICGTDTIRLPDPLTLEYGQVSTTRDTQCVSEKIGVTCVARNGNGAFFLRKGQYLLFNP